MSKLLVDNFEFNNMADLVSAMKFNIRGNWKSPILEFKSKAIIPNGYYDFRIGDYLFTRTYIEFFPYNKIPEDVRYDASEYYTYQSSTYEFIEI